MSKSPSFLRWVGSKARLLPAIKEYLPETCFNYFEPFCGGASLFFDYGYKCQGRAYLNDINYPLINTYEMLCGYPKDVKERLETTFRHASYDLIRNQFNDYKKSFESLGQWGTLERIEFAALFIALNHLCFNGVYRENKKGEFNVPLGTDSKKNPRTMDSFNKDKLSEAIEKLRTTNLCLTYQSFFPWQFLGMPERNDVVFYDSPYLNEFSQYDKSGFTSEDHEHLCEQATSIAQSGATVIVCGSNNDASRAIYGTPTKVIELSRTVGHSKRKKATECLWVYNGRR